MASETSRLYYPAARAILQVVFDGFGDSARDSDIEIIPVLPKSVTIHRNGYNMADSWEMTFSASDLPIDPQMIRAAAAEIFLFNMPGIDDNRRVLSQQFAAVDDKASALRRQPQDSNEVDAGVPRARDEFTFGNRPMVVGQWDESSLDFSDDGRWVTIQGQDYTAYLAAKQWPPTAKGTARRIPTGQKLDKFVQQLLDEADPDKRLVVALEGVTSADMPTVGKGETSTNGRGIPIEANTSYWDVIYKVVTRYGFICFVDGLDLKITRPKNIENIATHDIKSMAWGRNLSNLHLARHLGKEKVPRIIIKSWDPVLRENILIEFPSTRLGGKVPTLKGKPKDKTQKTDRYKMGDTPKRPTKKVETLKLEDEYQIIPMYGISDRAVLRRAAENLYQILGHGERRMVATTRDLTDADGRSLMRLAAGDAVNVDFVGFDRTLFQDPSVSQQERYQHLIRRGFSTTVSKAIAEHFEKLIGNQRPLRVREATYHYDADDGIEIEMELIDFVVVDGERDSSSAQRTKDKLASRTVLGASR